MVKEKLVHFPEFILRAGGLCRFRRVMGVR
jgi:hypothetical protein